MSKRIRKTVKAWAVFDVYLKEPRLMRIALAEPRPRFEQIALPCMIAYYLPVKKEKKE